MAIADNVKRIQSELLPGVKLVVVTKNHSAREIEAMLNTGILDIGENRIQEAREKFPFLPTETPQGTVTRHLIGHLQTNKAKYAVALFDQIHSVDSVHLAKALEKEAAKLNRTLPILLQVNIANDPNKHGLKAEEVAHTLETIRATCPHLPVEGLMTIVPHEENPEAVRPHFRALRALRDQLGLKELSMGMSQDYRVAMEEGATLIRIGSAIFA